MLSFPPPSQPNLYINTLQLQILSEKITTKLPKLGNPSNHILRDFTRMVGIRPFVKTLQKGFSFFARTRSGLGDDDDEEMEVAATMVPDDVKEGHFVALAAKGEEAQRFVIELRFLTNPAFLWLLDQAEEEYGFKQKGALTLPCTPHDLQTILDQDRCNSS